MKSDDELLKVGCKLLEIRCANGIEETDMVVALLEPYTREEVERMNDLLVEEYPEMIEAETHETWLRHHGPGSENPRPLV